MSYLGFVVVGTGVGWLLKGPLANTAVVRGDRSVANWFVDRAEGKADQTAGEVKQVADKAVDKVKQAVKKLRD